MVTATVTINYDPDAHTLCFLLYDLSDEALDFPERFDGKTHRVEADGHYYSYRVEEELDHENT